jgi:hypothetical protein
MTATAEKVDNGNPATLVAILVAARRSGDRELENYARDRLSRDHGIRSPPVEFSVVGGDTPTDELLERLADFLLDLVDGEESNE